MPKQSKDPAREGAPVRTCLGCMCRDAKSAMVRIAQSGGRLAVDPQARLEGRGGYLHRRPECLERFLRTRLREFKSLGRRLTREERLAVVKQLAQGGGRVAG